MLRSLYSGISGMKVNQTKLDVIGNNIANVGTISFKSARVRFQDMLSQNVSQALAPGANLGGSNPRQVGLGVQMAGIDTLMSQGMMQPTGRNLDVAMDGEGYFMVGKGQLPSTNPNGISLRTDNTIDNTKASDISSIMYTRDGALTLDTDGNLLTSDGYRVLGYALKDGENSTSLSTSYSEDATTFERKAVLNFVNADSQDLQADPVLVPLVIKDTVSTLSKDANGADILVDKRITTFSIEKNGVIKAVLDDGSVTVLGQIAVSSFKNPAGLTKLGKNLYQNSANSGEPVVRSGLNSATDNSKGYGDMLQGMLEMSNVDLAEQFTDMIVTSRAFQANSKTISTGDEILQEILNLKR
jgi:flagellar hook protein FlgE